MNIMLNDTQHFSISFGHSLQLLLTNYTVIFLQDSVKPVYSALNPKWFQTVFRTDIVQMIINYLCIPHTECKVCKECKECFLIKTNTKPTYSQLAILHSLTGLFDWYCRGILPIVCYSSSDAHFHH